MTPQDQKTKSHLKTTVKQAQLSNCEKPVYSFISFLLAFCLVSSAIALTACEQGSAFKYTEQRTLHSSYYQLQATHHMFPNFGGMGGGIASVNGHWLIVPADGDLFVFKRAETGDDFQIRQLPYKVPMNRELLGATTPLDKQHEKLLFKWFRVADVATNQSGGMLQLWVSHHWWHERESCATLRVSTATAGAGEFLSGQLPALDWSTLYEATPCLKVQDYGFSGYGAGGRMVLAGNPPSSLYLTVGSHGVDGLKSMPSFSQDPEVTWGKVMKIDLQGGAATVFTMGHRNPQGLFLDDLGRMWLTEHGPRGGDELNLLEEGKNYGWPLVTYGTDYDTYDPWPLSRDPGSNGGFELPIYSWVPSIGVSDVIRLQGNRFPLWKGDILAGSLKGKSIYRIHFREGRAIIVEPIEVKKRIRDMAEGPDGEIVLWTDNHRLIFVEPVLNPEYPED